VNLDEADIIGVSLHILDFFHGVVVVDPESHVICYQYQS